MKRRFGLFAYLLPAAIVALAAILRFWRFGAVAFTFDAAAVSNLAMQWIDQGRLPLQGMVSSTGFKNPALTVYLISLPVWFNRDPLVLTGFVAALNVLAVFGTFWLGRRYWSTAVGLLAALLFAVSPWAVQHSRGVLGQDLLTPGVVVLIILVMAWFVDGRRWFLAATLVMLAVLIQIHLAAVALGPMIVGLLVWEWIALRQRKAFARLWLPLALGLVLGMLLFIPYLVADSQQDWENVRGFLALDRSGPGLQLQVLDLALINVGGRNIHALVGPTRFREFLAELPVPGYGPDRFEELIVVASTIYLGFELVRNRCDARRAKSYGLLLLWLLVPVVFFLVFNVEVHLHYLVVLYPAPFLVLAVAAADVYRRLNGRISLRRSLVGLSATGLALLVAWQIMLIDAIYRFIDLHHTPDGWPTPIRIVREAAYTLAEYASLNPGGEVIVLCRGQVPEWDECPAVWTFLTSRLPNTRIQDFNDPQFRIYQEAEEALFLLTPGDSLAAAELPLLATALPEADVPLRENQGAYRFYRIHNPYRDISSYLERMTKPGDAILLVGPDQQRALVRFYRGSLPVYELPQLPFDSSTTYSQLAQLASQYHRLLVLYRVPEATDPEGTVERWLTEYAYGGREIWLGPVRTVTYVLPNGEKTWNVLHPNVNFGDQFRLVEVARLEEHIVAGDLLPVRLVWEALVQPAADYTLFLQVLDPENQVVAQRDLPLLVATQRTSSWHAGQQVEMRLGIALPVGSAPGNYRLITGLYEPQTGIRLPVGNIDFLDLGVLSVEAAAPEAIDLASVRYRPGYDLGEVILEGFQRYKRDHEHAPNAPLKPGDTLDLLFYWRAKHRPTTDWMLSVRLLDDDKNVVASLSAPLAGKRYLSSQWRAGELVRGLHRLVLPTNLVAGRYRMQVAVHHLDHSNPADWLPLGRLLVEAMQ